MKLKALTTLFIVLVLSACHSQTSSLSSEVNSTNSPSSNITSEPSSALSTNETSSLTPSSESSSYSAWTWNPEDSFHAYDDYYVSLSTWENGEDLKEKLYQLSRKNYRPLTYNKPNYETNINADHTKYDYESLDVIYKFSGCKVSDTNTGWQREHAFCASLMCGSTTANAVKQKGRATDFHNLFAADASANSARGNKNYGEANTNAESYINKMTDAMNSDGYSSDSVNFEPGNKDKGRVARAIFYMAMMYKNDEVDTVNNVNMKGLKIVESPVSYAAGNNCSFAIGNLSTLLKWNKTYPVDYLEMQHNISVYKDVYSGDGYAQGNRNPFVDFPYLAEYVYGQFKNQAGSLGNITPSEYDLHCETKNKAFSHYALKEAKREYAPGTSIQPNDYKIVKVYTNYETELVTSGITTSLDEHVFSYEDGDSIWCTVRIDDQYVASYDIVLNPLGACSTGEIYLNTTGIDKGKAGEDQLVTYGGIDFYLNFESSADISSSKTMTINNINENNKPIGMTLGSKNRPLTKFTLTSLNSYKIDAAYIKCYIGNNESDYWLSIKVGNHRFVNTHHVSNDAVQIFGSVEQEAYEGQITYYFEGSSSLKINSIAFNQIIA